MTDVLSRILAYKREEVAARKAEARDVESRARAQSPPRGFARAIETASGMALIAEIKKASPSRGLIRGDFEPTALAQAYERGGAACLSVLTDAPSFQGADAHLAAVRSACALPCLRKEFLVDPWQVAESRALGADAVLVIMAAVDDALGADLVASAARWGMDALVECHDEPEVERALLLGARLIGINNRDLKTFETRLETTERLARLVPADRVLVAESGIFTPEDVRRVAIAGARAILVGESLMKQNDVETATKALLAAT